MKDERSCFNCHHTVDANSNYCPNCGQKIDDNNLSLKAVFIEFYENYLSFDTRLGRSIVPFLFSPGILTQQFVQGKRVSFVNPFRFYLVISVLFFYSLGMVLGQSFLRESEKADLQVEEIAKLIDSKPKKQLNKEEYGLDSLETPTDSVLVDSMQDADLEMVDNDQEVSHVLDSAKKEGGNGVSFGLSPGNIKLNLSSFNAVKAYRFNRAYSDAQLLDTLGVETDSISPFRYKIFSQGMKLYRSDIRVITKFVLSNLSIGMFLLIPLLALCFMLFFWKQRIPFVAHLIHSLQLHTFSLFVFGIALLIRYYIGYTHITIYAFVISAVYFFFSVKRVYGKTYISSLLRVVAIGFLYYFIWVGVLLLGLTVSFILF